MKRILSLILISLSLSFSAMAQIQEVKLTATGEGRTKDEANTNALKYCVEQTYGTFVSSQTQLINDDIVLDQMATVSSGNIKEYKEVASVKIDDGHYSVTIEAVVSIGKLISYAESKGANCDFAGQSLDANIQLYNFNKKNELAVFDNLCKQIDALRPFYDYEVSVKDQKVGKDGNGDVVLTLQTSVKSNNKTKAVVDLIRNTLSSIAMTQKDIQPFKQLGLDFYGYMMYFSDEYVDKSRWRLSFRQRPNYYFYNIIPELLREILQQSAFDFKISDNCSNIYRYYLKKADICENCSNRFYSHGAPFSYTHYKEKFKSLSESWSPNYGYQYNWSCDFIGNGIKVQFELLKNGIAAKRETCGPRLDRSGACMSAYNFVNMDIFKFGDYLANNFEDVYGIIYFDAGTKDDNIIFDIQDDFIISSSCVSKINNIKIEPKTNEYYICPEKIGANDISHPYKTAIEETTQNEEISSTCSQTEATNNMRAVSCNEASNENNASSNHKYYIGEYIPLYGGGIVYWISNDGKHAKLISSDEAEWLPWEESVAWCNNYGNSTWTMPSIEELAEIQKVVKIINATSVQEGFKLIDMDNICYWSSTEYQTNYAYRLRMNDGLTLKYGSDESKGSKKNRTRAIKTI